MNVGIDKKLACLLCSKPILSIIYENFYFHHELLVILLFCLSRGIYKISAAKNLSVKSFVN